MHADPHRWCVGAFASSGLNRSGSGKRSARSRAERASDESRARSRLSSTICPDSPARIACSVCSFRRMRPISSSSMETIKR